MGDKKSVSALVSGGEANAGPPLGPALGPLGINVLQVVNMINDKTKDFPGMKVPVKVTVEVGIPPTTALIAKEANILKGSGTAGINYAGSITMASAIKIAKMKIEISYAKDIKGVVKEVIGSCMSAGVKVEDKTAKEVYSDISAERYNELFK